MVSSEITSRPPVAAIISNIPKSNRSNFFNSLKLIVFPESLLDRLFEELNLSLNKFNLFL